MGAFFGMALLILNTMGAFAIFACKYVGLSENPGVLKHFHQITESACKLHLLHYVAGWACILVVAMDSSPHVLFSLCALFFFLKISCYSSFSFIF